MLSESFIDAAIERIVVKLEKLPGPKIAPRYLSYEQAVNIWAYRVKPFVRTSRLATSGPMKGGGNRWFLTLLLFIRRG